METKHQVSRFLLFLITGIALFVRKPVRGMPLAFRLRKGSLVSLTQEILLLTQRLPNPREADINSTHLIQLLGENYDPRYMAVDLPTPTRSFGFKLLERSVTYGRDQQDTMSSRLRKMQFKIKKAGLGRKRLLGERASSKLRQWLYELSRCPMKYKWVDIGKKFFPRYLREGSCVKKQCSFPRGMSCLPSKRKLLRMLIWLCFNATRETCGWRELDIETIISCKCACDN